jgi:hypothetical protein
MKYIIIMESAGWTYYWTGANWFTNRKKAKEIPTEDLQGELQTVLIYVQYMSHKRLIIEAL